MPVGRLIGRAYWRLTWRLPFSVILRPLDAAIRNIPGFMQGWDGARKLTADRLYDKRH